MCFEKMLSNLTKYNLILASQSPRRQELLRGLNIPFSVQAIDVEENYPAGIPVEEIPRYLAEKKADAYSLDENTMLITADTIVCLDNKVLEKPRDKADAVRMLSELSGKTHEVITGVCIRTRAKCKTFSEISRVRFAELSAEEIEFYVENYRPYDKAGAYGIQEWIGYIGVEHIEGSFYNIMGLPIQRLYVELKNWE